jgi:hypothetical protein
LDDALVLDDFQYFSVGIALNGHAFFKSGGDASGT